MYHFQVDNMEARLFFLYVICQMIITESLGGVTLPFPDLVGKVTPLKPKPLSPSSLCQDTKPKLCPSALGGSAFPEFSSALAFTSSSRALPVPKIDSMSMENVKMPERLREKFEAKLNRAIVRKANPVIGPPEVSSYKCQFPSISPAYSSSEMYQSSSNKLSPLPSIKSLPIVSVKPLKSFNVPLPTYEKPLTLESKQPLFWEHCTTNTLLPSSPSYSLPYPLYYKSMYLPGVRTPSDMLPINYKPTTIAESINLNYQSQSYAQNLLTSASSEILKHNMVKIPKPSSNLPVLIKPVSSSPAVQNLWSSLDPIHSCTSSQLPRSRFDPNEYLLSDLKNDKDLKSLLDSLSCTLVDKIYDYKQKPSSSPKISSVARVPNIYPIVDSHAQTISRVTFDSIPSFREINVPEITNRLIVPATMYYQNPLLPNKCDPNTLKYLTPIIPREPTIPSVTSNVSPSVYCPPKILQNPISPSISCVSQPSTSITAQSTAKMLTPINDLVSNIAQCILSSYKTYTDSALQNVLQKARCTLQSNPYADAKLDQIPSVVTLPPVNPVNIPSMLPIISSPNDCICLPVAETFTDLSMDASYIPSTFEMSTSYPVSMSSQPFAATVLPVSSLVSFSSPQLCPSYLPSPTLPSYPSIASPFYMEAPVYKVSSSKKESKLEKLIEMMLIAEILNNDDSFDWDDLDTLLAFLFVS